MDSGARLDQGGGDSRVPVGEKCGCMVRNCVEGGEVGQHELVDGRSGGGKHADDPETHRNIVCSGGSGMAVLGLDHCADGRVEVDRCCCAKNHVKGWFYCRGISKTRAQLPNDRRERLWIRAERASCREWDPAPGTIGEPAQIGGEDAGVADAVSEGQGDDGADFGGCREGLGERQ